MPRRMGMPWCTVGAVPAVPAFILCRHGRSRMAMDLQSSRMAPGPPSFHAYTYPDHPHTYMQSHPHALTCADAGCVHCCRHMQSRTGTHTHTHARACTMNHVHVPCPCTMYHVHEPCTMHHVHMHTHAHAQTRTPNRCAGSMIEMMKFDMGGGARGRGAVFFISFERSGGARGSRGFWFALLCALRQLH